MIQNVNIVHKLTVGEVKNGTSLNVIKIQVILGVVALKLSLYCFMDVYVQITYTIQTHS